MPLGMAAPAGRPAQWRILAVFTGHAREDTSAGVVGSEFADLHGSEADVRRQLCFQPWESPLSSIVLPHPISLQDRSRRASRPSRRTGMSHVQHRA